MKRYERYKDSGVEWIGEIPARWEVKRLKFNTYIKARVGWHGLRADEFSLTDGVFCITGTDLQNGKVNWENCYRVSEDRYNEDPYIQVKEKDLLITKDGTIGKVAVVQNLREKATLNSGVFVVRPEREQYSTPYMYWAFQSPVFSEYVYYASKGSTINHLYQETFFNLPFILPLPTEQTAIAAYLDEKTARIDKLIANKQRLIELLKEERTAIINHAVTKGINPNAGLKPSGIEWVGDIPKHWEVKKLKYVANKVQTGSTPPSNQEEYYEEQINWFTPADFSESLCLKNSKRKLSELAVKDEVVKLFPANSVLLVGIGATLGKVGYIEEPSSSNQQINAIYLDNLEKAKFYAYFLHVNKNNVVSLANAATLAILNQSQTKDIPLPVPSTTAELESIVRFIEKKEVDFVSTLAKIEKEIELMQEYRTALISEVVTGKIKVI